jgi:UDP-2,3-diacylglucosamine pyrophosphatase LpxH
MRALVISDSHLGAWTGEDLLAQDQYLERLAPHLDDIDELIVLGDLFDLLFGSIQDAFSAAEGLFDLATEKLQGKRLVFLAGNHDHRFVVREAEDLLQMELATGSSAAELRDELARDQMPRRFLERRLEGVEIDVRYPTYTFAGVLCTHGHYLDPHARLAGPLGSRLLTKALWAIASGGPEQPRTEADYESVITLLTEMLYTIAQLPHGTTAQRNVFRTRGTVARVVRAGGAPYRAIQRLAARIREGGEAAGGDGSGRSGTVSFDDYLREQALEAERRQGRATPAIPHDIPGYDLARTVRPGDPRGRALEAIAQVVENLGWARDTDKIVFAHTHQPIADARVPLTGDVRYWNTGSWIYEPELGSHDAYVRYLRNAWPGTCIVIDSEEESPRLIAPLADLNPLTGGPGITTGEPSEGG